MLRSSLSALLLLLGCASASADVFERLAPGAWYEVPDSKLVSVAPPADRYPEIQGDKGVRGIMEAYGGGAYDTRRDRLLVWSRGDKRYRGNEIYAFDIGTLRWQRVTEPSLPSPEDEARGYTSDGAPVARRTYNNLVYLPEPIDALWAQGGAVGTKLREDKLTWMYAFEDRAWKRLADAPASAYYNYSSYDPVSGRVWHHPNKRLLSYDPAGDRWHDHGARPGLWGSKSAAIDAKRRKLVIVGKGAVLAYDLRGPGRYERLATQGANEIVQADSPGFVYDPDSDRFVAWGGGADVYTLEFDSLTWRRHPPAGNNRVRPPTDAGRGIFGRFQRVASRDAFLLAPSASDNVYLYRLDVQSGTAEAMPQTGVQIERTGKWYATPSAAARDAIDGDVVEIQAGVYPGDVAVWRQHRLTLRGVGGRAHLRADGRAAQGKAIWVLSGDETVVESIEFSGARVSDGNGAGIRLQGRGLTVRDCYLHHNQNGILGGHPEGSVLIEDSEFAYNGAGDGRAHNLYIGKGRRLELRSSKLHHAIMGHQVKSRTAETSIEHNLILDGPDGRSSYAIDIPNGGTARIHGNVIQQGPRTENLTMIRYGAEGIEHPHNSLEITANVLIDESGRAGRFLRADGVESVFEDNITLRGSRQ